MTKSVKALFSDCDENNDVATRKERRDRLGALHVRVGEWLTELESRGPGPTAKEMKMILTDLREHLDTMDRKEL